VTDTSSCLNITPIDDNDTDEADRRAVRHLRDDPFKNDVAPSLLSSADIERYAVATAMLLPFRKDRLKTASYEIRPGGRFIYWEKAEGKIKRVDGEISSDSPCRGWEGTHADASSTARLSPAISAMAKCACGIHAFRRRNGSTGPELC
jgi:hypothetical protein